MIAASNIVPRGAGALKVETDVLALVRHHASLVGRLDHDAVGAHVAHPRLRVLGHPERRGEVRRGVEAGSGNRVWELKNAVVLENVVADMHLLQDRTVVDEPRLEVALWTSSQRSVIPSGAQPRAFA